MKKSKSELKQGVGKIISNNLRMYAKIARLTPSFFIVTVIKGLMFGANASAEALFTVKLFDAIDSGAEFSEVAFIIGMLAAFYFVFYLINAINRQFLIPLLQQKLRLRLHTELFKKAQKIDLSCYDDPEYYNDFVWAMDESGRCAVDMMEDLSTIITRLVAGSTLFSVLFSIDKIVALILLLFSILGVVIGQIGNKLHYKQEKEFKPLGRVRSYINRVFHLQEYAKEIRVSRVADILMERMDENTEKMVKTSIKYGKKFFILYGVFDTILQDLVYYGVLFYMFAKLLGGKILVGGFAASTGMIWRVRWQLKDLVARLMKLPKNSLFLEKYYGFLAYETKTVTGDKKLDSFDSLELRGVSFRYDFSSNEKYKYHESDHKIKTNENADSFALKKVDLTLQKGEKIAIVGYNGAGKTTLIKLLMRLYDVTEGEVLVNGINIKEYDLSDYRQHLGVVFQDFKIFAATVAENVMNGHYDEKTDKETVLAALEAAGFGEKLATLEKGVDTVLTREFDKKGTNLSGGQRQRLLIARAIAASPDILILDDSSSALDYKTDANLRRALSEQMTNTTIVTVAQRVSSVKDSDVILVLDDGKIIGKGTHEELLCSCPEYKEISDSQMGGAFVE